MTFSPCIVSGYVLKSDSCKCAL